jgi:hypothetical protein
MRAAMVSSVFSASKPSKRGHAFTLKDLKIRAGVEKRISGQETTIINVLKEK